MKDLLKDIRQCNICAAHLPMGPRPVLSASSNARILIAGQAPGKRVHETGIPWNDPSGERLREWMGIPSDIFYDDQKIAIIPMGFCYPGTGKSGDLPPRSECADTWRAKLMASLPKIELTLVIGQYAQNWHIKGQQKRTLTETVKSWQDYQPAIIPLPHPSPRNNLWLRKNPWFEQDLLPVLKRRIKKII